MLIPKAPKQSACSISFRGIWQLAKFSEVHGSVVVGWWVKIWGTQKASGRDRLAFAGLFFHGSFRLDTPAPAAILHA